MADVCADEGVYLGPAVQRYLRNRLSRIEGYTSSCVTVGLKECDPAALDGRTLGGRMEGEKPLFPAAWILEDARRGGAEQGSGSPGELN